MDKDGVLRVLVEMADLLEILEAGSFEIMAFRSATRSLMDWEGDLAAAAAAGTLTDIDRVGKGIAKVITQLVQQGAAAEHDELRSRFPAGLPALLSLSGIGPKKVKALWQQLGVESLDDLEAAAKAERVRALKGFGAKTEEKILRSIDWVRSPRKQAPSTPTPRAAAPGPAQASRGALFLGTSGYSYDEWKGTFYPDDLGKDDFLAHYASRLGTVEINNTFYRFPTTKVLEQWAAQVPAGFRFAVKANQRITHRLRLKSAGDVTTGFVERCRDLGPRLGCILFQLPPDLQRDDARLLAFLEGLPQGTRYALEFRHESWLDPAVFARLAEHEVALVIHDDESLPCPRETTTNFTYVRMRRDSYDAAMLADWGGWFAGQAAAGRDVFAYIKHDEQGTSPMEILDHWLPAAAVPRKAASSASRKKRGTRRA